MGAQPAAARASPGKVTIWNDNKAAYLSPYRTVLAQQAPEALASLDVKAPGEIGQGNYIKTNYDDELLNLLRAAYREARSGQA